MRNVIHRDCKFLFMWLIAFALAIGSVTFATAQVRAEETKGIERWAILSANPEKDGGISELLTVELSNRNYKLVERTELAKVTKELELASLLGSKAAGKRLQLGKLLKADALLLIDVGKAGRQQQVQTVICECRFGARLSIATWQAGKVDELATKIADQVAATKRHYSGGIRKIFAVTPFVAHNLLPTHNHLQAGYSHLLQSALRNSPGVACIEVEEARAIARELQIDSSRLQKRHVPVFVDGEFEFVKNSNGEERINIQVRARGGESELATYKQTDRTMEETTAWLVDTAATEILTSARLKPNKRLTREQQKKLLQAKADEFERYRGWEHAAGLREAALLLDPDDWKLAVAVVSARRQVLVTSTPLWSADRTTKARHWKKFEPIQQRRWEAMLFRVEEIIARGNFGARPAMELIAMGADSVKVLQKSGQPTSKEVDKRLQTFLRTTIARIPELSEKYDANPAVEREFWVRRFMEFFVRRKVATGRRGNVEAVDREYDNMYWLLADVVPRDAPPVHAIANHITPNSLEAGGLLQTLSPGSSATRTRNLFERLSQTESEACKFYGRAGLLSLHVFTQKDQKGYSLESEKRIRELQAYLKKKGQSKNAWNESSSRFVLHLKGQLDNIRRTRGRIAKAKALSEWKKSRPPPTRRRFSISGARIIRPYALAPRVRFEEIKGVNIDWFAFEKVNETTDVTWTLDTVSVARKETLVIRIFRLADYSRDPVDFVRYVNWDGENYWIITNRSGIYAVSSQGVLLGRAQPGKRLPPYSSALRRSRRNTLLKPGSPLVLEPIAPGKCVAAGSINQRGWIALLQLPDKASTDRSMTVSVLHKGIADLDPKVSAADTIKGRFSASWIRRMKPMDGKNDFLLVGDRNPPLRISLPDLKITPYQEPYPTISSFFGRLGLIRLGDRFLYARGTDVQLHALTDKAKNSWNVKELIKAPRFGGKRYSLVPWQGSVYCFGADWYRIDPKTAKVERLCDAPLPLRFQFDYVAESARYGLIAWFDRDGVNTRDSRIDRSKVYRVLFSPDEPADKYWLYSHVPLELRARHARAVEAIWKLGGKVGDWFNGRKIYTNATLDKSWKGGDEGLVHFKDVYGLENLTVTQAAVTDKGMKHISQIPTLQKLALNDTRVTDAGLKYLGSATKLNNLLLRSPFRGKHFSDAGLAHLADVPLTGLTLYGWNFTNAALETLQTHKSLRTLALAGTAITNEAIEQSKQRQPRRQVRIILPDK